MTAAERVGGARRGLGEHEDPSLRIAGLDLVDPGCDRRRNALAAAGQDRTFDLSQPVCGEPELEELWKAMLVLVRLGTAHDVSTTEILQIVGERSQRRHDIIDIGDVLLPLGLLVLPASKLPDIDERCHASDAPYPGDRACDKRSAGTARPWRRTRAARGLDHDPRPVMGEAAWSSSRRRAPGRARTRPAGSRTA